MSQIDVHAFHRMTRADARDAADALAGDLAGKFDIDYGWDEDTLVFERPGVYGEIAIDESAIHVHAELGLLLAFLKPRIEGEVRRYLKDHFQCTFTP